MTDAGVYSLNIPRVGRHSSSKYLRALRLVVLSSSCYRRYDDVIHSEMMHWHPWFQQYIYVFILPYRIQHFSLTHRPGLFLLSLLLP